MKLLLTDAQLEERRELTRGGFSSSDTARATRSDTAGPLAPLADSLAADLEPLLGDPLYIPSEKALLSKVGGRCETDGTDLDFNPFSPHEHRCLSCGRLHTGEYHDRWWLYPYHLWLAERAVHAAVLFALRGDARHGTLAKEILTGYADRYLEYPNRDNVLGPSRLFFSTYLESLWLLHICIAADALEGAGDRATADDVRKRIVRPAVELIEQYNEDLSNRQVWNDAAIIAARLFLGDRVQSPAVGRAFASIETILANAVGEDGSWYEGDNYHQFAHRGLWYAVALGERAGYDFDAESITRFEAGFAAPFRSALPDFTYPARKDSRYAASLRQWRFAESAELGLARQDDPMLSWALSLMYADDGSTRNAAPENAAPGTTAPGDTPRDTGRARSSGEAERHVPAVRLTRADLGWRSLLFAQPHLPTVLAECPESLTIASQGLTIHRRDQGAVYVALDWGESGGGHGHPDRLNLLFSHGARRWLDDLGTGSYVDESLHWYRSTLAHNAPLIDGRSQARVNGECIGEGAQSGFDFVAACADELAPGVRVERSLVTGDGYFIDEVRWAATSNVRFDLPIHFDAACELPMMPRLLDGGHAIEDGFAHVGDSSVGNLLPRTAVALRAQGARAEMWADHPGELFHVTGPGQPANQRRSFYVLRFDGTGGVIRSVWSWSDTPLDVNFSDDGVAVMVNGTAHAHQTTESRWLVRVADVQVAQFTRTPLDHPLEIDDQSPGSALPHLVEPHDLSVCPQHDGWFSDLTPSEQDDWAVFELGEANYRRSEDSWREAGRPRARAAVCAEDGGLVIDIAVQTEHPVFVPADATNPLDNEHPDINGHGVQLYLATDDQSGAWVVVPEAGAADVRVRQLTAWGSFASPTATWRSVIGGFEMQIRLPFETSDPTMVGLDLIVNDASPDRLRRRGQLVMSGAEDEFVYLRGDRHDPARLIPFSVS